MQAVGGDGLGNQMRIPATLAKTSRYFRPCRVRNHDGEEQATPSQELHDVQTEALLLDLLAMDGMRMFGVGDWASL